MTNRLYVINSGLSMHLYKKKYVIQSINVYTLFFFISLQSVHFPSFVSIMFLSAISKQH